MNGPHLCTTVSKLKQSKWDQDCMAGLLGKLRYQTKQIEAIKKILQMGHICEIP